MKGIPLNPQPDLVALLHRPTTTRIVYEQGGRLVNICSGGKDKYEFGFNGQMKTNEIAGTGNHNTALFWEYDTRTGRRWNRDPKPNPSASNYSTYAGNPIWNSDVLGDTTYRFSGATGLYIGMKDLKESGSRGLIEKYKFGKKAVDLNFEFADPEGDSKSIRSGSINQLYYASPKAIEDDVRRGVNGPKWYQSGPVEGSAYLYKHSNATANDGKTDYVLSSTFHGPVSSMTSWGPGLSAGALYLTVVDNKLIGHNSYNYGNFLWGASAAALKVPEWMSKAGAHANNYFNDPLSRGHLDSPDDQFSIGLGYKTWMSLQEKK